MRVFHKMMTVAIGMAAICSCCNELTVTQSDSDLTFSSLADVWDEAVPLGNAKVGALVWKKGDALRMSLDHYDLWDLRPVKAFDAGNPEFNYEWLKQELREGRVGRADSLGLDYNSGAPGSAKIPGAALEFPLEGLGEVTSVRLYLNNALCRVEWTSGATLETFLQAERPVGWFVFRDVPQGFKPTVKAPAYDTSLSALGYPQGTIDEAGNSIRYHQQGWGDFFYDVAVQWKSRDGVVEGAWGVSTSLNEYDAATEVAEALRRSVGKDYKNHMKWWNAFWAESTVCVPDPVIQKQFDNEIYKLGSASHEDSRPISLQAVWTADDGNMPPWRGDYHHDLNTQLSYWPVYSGNHLNEGLAFINMLWDQRDEYRKFAKEYFGVDGLIVPGHADLLGHLLPGWIQYNCSPTTGAWLAHHFWLHWKYSADDEFLRERGYPFLKDVAIALEGVTEKKYSEQESREIRTLEFSTSPEIFGDLLQAYFKTITNYDLALIRFAFDAASEMADALGLSDEAGHWAAMRDEMPEFDLDADGGLTFAQGYPFNGYFTLNHLMAILPFGQIDWSQGEESQDIIKASIDRIEECGLYGWLGYTHTWYANLLARAMDGDAAVAILKKFQKYFIQPNTFHANGDQSGTNISSFTYRPFTLEGNFAFASAVQEMLIQSHTGTIRVFPAIPTSWKDVSFKNLRAMGAFLVSAEMKDGSLVSVEVLSEKGGHLRILLPGDTEPRECDMTPGQRVVYSVSPSSRPL